MSSTCRLQRNIRQVALAVVVSVLASAPGQAEEVLGRKFSVSEGGRPYDIRVMRDGRIYVSAVACGGSYFGTAAQLGQSITFTEHCPGGKGRDGTGQSTASFDGQTLSIESSDNFGFNHSYYVTISGSKCHGHVIAGMSDKGQQIANSDGAFKSCRMSKL